MIASIITLAMQIALPLINLFIKNAERKRALKESMFKIIEQHSKNILRNVQLNRELEELRSQARKPNEDKQNEKGKEEAINKS